MDFKTEMAERTAQIEQIIKKYLPKEEGYQKTICLLYTSPSPRDS